MTRQKFLKEFTSKFSQLYVETFKIRYFHEFKDYSKFVDDFADSINITNERIIDEFEKLIKEIEKKD